MLCSLDQWQSPPNPFTDKGALCFWVSLSQTCYFGNKCTVSEWHKGSTKEPPFRLKAPRVEGKTAITGRRGEKLNTGKLLPRVSGGHGKMILSFLSLLKYLSLAPGTIGSCVTGPISFICLLIFPFFFFYLAYWAKWVIMYTSRPEQHGARLSLQMR